MTTPPKFLPTQVASILLLASAAAQSFVCVLIAWIVPPAFHSIYRLKSLHEAWDLMPPITRFASENSWLIVIALGAVCLGSLLALRRFPERTIHCMTVGLCAEGFVTWLAMFCFCFDGFTGPMSLHHGPEFELPQFISFGAGVFPVTLLLVVAPIIAALWPRVNSKP